MLSVRLALDMRECQHSHWPSANALRQSSPNKSRMSIQPQLSPRKEAILRALVDEYIRTGEPVPSKLLADQLLGLYPSGISSATVRNELAALEEAGLILQ